jgi:EmrB/QacA subfamily drug resistance transporter
MRGKRGVLAVLCTAEILVALDGMIVSVALPSIQRDLGMPAAALQWVVTAYTLALGAFLLLGGRIADTLGHRRTLQIGLAVFAAGSLAAGLARAQGPLLAGRAVSGLGAALAIPAALALVTDVFPEGRDRNRALGLMSAGIDAGLVLGAVLGGIVTAALGWPWVFFAIVPAGLAALALTARAVPASRPPALRRRLDAPGALLAAGGSGLLVAALTRAEAAGVTAPTTLATLAGSLALLAAFVARERRAPDPLLPGRLLRRRRALSANLAIVANAGAFGGVLVVGTLHLQQVLGFSALEAGLAFVPLAVSAAAGGPLAAPLVERFGVRAMVSTGMLATAASLVLLSRAGADGSYATGVLPAFAVAGFTFAVAAVPLTAEAVAEAAAAETGVAAGLFQTATHVGGAVVLAVLVVAAAARTEAAAGSGASPAEALVAGHRLAFALAAALLTATAATFLTLAAGSRRPSRRRSGARTRAC